MVKNLKRRDRLKMGLLKLGEVAEATDSLPSTVRYYSNLGLLTISDYTQGKYRLFKKGETLERMSKIKELKRQGFTLDEIRRKLRS